MESTRDKIINASIKLFNEKGVSDVTLRDIATDVGISIGNLAYHFKNKDFIIKEAFAQMESEKNEILAGVQQIPSFENINYQLGPLMMVSEKYQFFFIDTVQIVKKFPKIAEMHRDYIENSISYIKAVLDYSVGTGNMYAEKESGDYMRMARIVWMIIYCSIPQKEIRGLKSLDVEEISRSLWSLVKPFLTEKGKLNFDKINSVNATH